MPRNPGDDRLDAVAAARRRLLKIGVYTAPAIIGTLLIPTGAQAQTTPSCQPNLCKPAPCSPRPCGPMPCNPNQCKPRQ